MGSQQRKTGGYSIFDIKDEEIKKYNFEKIHKKLCRIKKGDDLIKLKNKKIAIKIDVERHEINVLKGIEELIKKNKIFLQIELFDKRKKNITDYLHSKKFVFLKKIKKDYFLKIFRILIQLYLNLEKYLILKFEYYSLIYK